MKTLLAMFIVAIGLTNVCIADEAKNLVEGAVLRRDALTSGKLIYTYESLPRKPTSFPKSVKIYLFSYLNWSSKTKDLPQTTASVNDGSFTYFERPLKEGQEIPIAGIQINAPVLYENKKHINKAPVFAGSFWVSRMALFAKEHAKDYKVVGTKNINGINTKICEIQVPKALAGQAFVKQQVGRTTEGGKIRLYIAPQHGYVMPLIEYFDIKNNLCMSFTASNFSETSTGVWLPKKISRIDVNKNPSKENNQKIFDISYERINEPIADSDFNISLPPGTQVQDFRHNVSYRVGDAGADSSDIGLNFPVESGWFGLTRMLAIMLGLVCAILGVCGWVVFRKKYA